MTDLAPDGRARLAGKKGTDIGKVRGEGAFFCGKRSGARLVRRGSSRSTAARADRERKAQDAFAEKEPKKSGASEKNVRMRAGDFCGKKRGLISDGAGTSKAESRYMQRRRPPARVRKSLRKEQSRLSGGGPPARVRKSLRKEQSRLSGGGPEKNKTPTGRGFGSASGGPHPHDFKGSEAVSFCFRRR